MRLPHITIWTYLWDLQFDGIGDTLRYLKNEVGATSVSIATSYHTVEHLRIHRREGPFIYRSRGALYFEPDSAKYRGSSVRPAVARWVRESGNPLLKVAEECRRLDLELVSWTVCCHNSELGHRQPELTMLNCFGDRYPEALCPAHPAMRAYLSGLVEDLSANYGIAVAELESCHYEPSRHYHHHEKIGIPFGPYENSLLALCFCPHCERQGRDAGLEMEGLRRRVSESLQHVFDTGDPERRSPAERVADDPELFKFVQVRQQVVNSLLSEMRSRSRAPLSPMPGGAPEASGLEPRSAAAAAGGLTVLAYSSDAGAVRRIIAEGARATGDIRLVRAGYHTYPPVNPNRETLLKNVRASLDEGLRAFSFYNYGIMPRRSLGWTAEAAALIRAAG